jgi:uncharacterized protein YycO
MFGRIKGYKFPFFLLYDPTTYALKGQHYLEAKKVIQRGDILLRGYDHYLDGYFIPGKYSHAAIYLGGPDERVIHAMTPDVQYTDLVSFMRCDRIAIVRPTLDLFETDLACERAISKKTTPYDYNFDFQDNGRMSCSELVHYAYRNVDTGWKMETVGFGPFKKVIFAPDGILSGQVEVQYMAPEQALDLGPDQELTE